jgi:hypothetical protein
MDFRNFASVILRHRRIAVAGIALAVILTIISAFSFFSDGSFVKWRPQPTYATTARLLLTQEGFPYGRATLIDENTPRDKNGSPIPQFADESRFAYLTPLYAQFASGDPVLRAVLGRDGVRKNKRLILDGGKIVGTYTAVALTTNDGNSTIPLIDITAESTSAAGSIAIAARVTNALRSYVTNIEGSSKVPPRKRIQLSVVESPTHARLIKSRPVVIPLVVFLLVSFATVLVIFFLENIRRKPEAPEGRGERAETAQAPPVKVSRRVTRTAEDGSDPPAKPSRPRATSRAKKAAETPGAATSTSLSTPETAGPPATEAPRPWRATQPKDPV